MLHTQNVSDSGLVHVVFKDLQQGKKSVLGRLHCTPFDREKPCQGDLSFLTSTRKSPTTQKSPSLEEIVNLQNEAAASINELVAETKALRRPHFVWVAETHYLQHKEIISGHL